MEHRVTVSTEKCGSGEVSLLGRVSHVLKILTRLKGWWNAKVVLNTQIPQPARSIVPVYQECIGTTRPVTRALKCQQVLREHSTAQAVHQARQL